MPLVYTADRIFTGKEWLHDHAIVAEDGMINNVVPLSSLASSQPVMQFADCFMAPSFIDAQIYGAGDRLLAVYPTIEALTLLKEQGAAGGTANCLPTVATNTKEVFFQCIDAVKAYWDNGGQGILGLHLEGPWLNPVKRGAHVESLIHPPSTDEVKALLDYGKNVIRVITLAPEMCSKEVIDLILSHDIIISAGHSNATYEQAVDGFSSGIQLVTHLFNAMSPLQHRAPGLAGAAMDDKRVMASIIPDGHHVDFAAIRIAKQAMGERLFVITDAVTGTTEGYYKHQLAGDKYEAGNILSGSSLTMAKAVQNLVNFGRIELGEALRMCSLYPARALGMKAHGLLETGFVASMVVMDENMQVKQLI